MKRKEHIIRTSKLIQALLMGYEVTLPQYIISYKRPNFYYKAECDGEPCFVKYVDLTLSSFEHIAKEMSEEEYDPLSCYSPAERKQIEEHLKRQEELMKQFNDAIDKHKEQ